MHYKRGRKRAYTETDALHKMFDRIVLDVIVD